MIYDKPPPRGKPLPADPIPTDHLLNQHSRMMEQAGVDPQSGKGSKSGRWEGATQAGDPQQFVNGIGPPFAAHRDAVSDPNQEAKIKEETGESQAEVVRESAAGEE